MQSSSTIHQQLQPTPRSSHLPPNPTTIFPQSSHYNSQQSSKPASSAHGSPNTNTSTNTNKLKSIATILNQALSTKDKQSIRQLLLNANFDVISNTVDDIGVTRLAAFMEVVQGVFADGVEDVTVLCMWVRLLLKKNIGHIINNPQLQTICHRLQKYIKQRQTLLPNLQNLSKKIPPHVPTPPTAKQYHPKFRYIEQQEQKQHNTSQQQNENENEEDKDQSDMSNIGPEDLAMLDQQLLDDDLAF